MTELTDNRHISKCDCPAPEVVDINANSSRSLAGLADEKIEQELYETKNKCIEVSNRIRNCQILLEQQDETLKNLQEKIAHLKHDRQSKQFNWNSVKAAHLISKIFENCDPVTREAPTVNIISDSANNNEACINTPNQRDAGSEDKPKINSPVSYTVEFHRFAIALYFFSYTTYLFLSKFFPIFPHQRYIRQWAAAGRVEKLFPYGVFREEFMEQ